MALPGSPRRERSPPPGDKQEKSSPAGIRLTRCSTYPSTQPGTICAAFSWRSGNSGITLSRLSISSSCGLRELGSGGRENLDAIVLVRIVRGGNHHAGGEFVLAGQEGYSRRGDDPGVHTPGRRWRRGRSQGHGKSTRSIRACPFPAPPARSWRAFLRTVPKALPIMRTVAMIQGILPGNATNAVRAEKFGFGGHSAMHCSAMPRLYRIILDPTQRVRPSPTRLKGIPHPRFACRAHVPSIPGNRPREGTGIHRQPGSRGSCKNLRRPWASIIFLGAARVIDCLTRPNGPDFRAARPEQNCKRSPSAPALWVCAMPLGIWPSLSEIGDPALAFPTRRICERNIRHNIPMFSEFSRIPFGHGRPVHARARARCPRHSGQNAHATTGCPFNILSLPYTSLTSCISFCEVL